VCAFAWALGAQGKLQAQEPTPRSVSSPAGRGGTTGSRSGASSPLHVELEACDDASAISADTLMQALQIELAPLTLARAEPSIVDPSVLREPHLKVSWCTALAKVTVYRPDAPAPLTRSLELADTPEFLRTRTLALAVGELWRSKQPELSEPAAPPAPKAPPEPAPPGRQALDDERPPGISSRVPPRERGSIAVGANAAMRAILFADTLMFGGELGVAGEVLQVGAVLLMTERDASLIDLGMGLAAGQLGIELVRIGHSPALALSARGELGTTWAAGQVASAGTERDFAWLVGGHLELALDAPMSQRWRGRLAASFGYNRGLTASVDGRTRFSTDGLMLGLSMGLRLGVRQ
jgi:hypothetical protein